MKAIIAAFKAFIMLLGGCALISIAVFVFFLLDDAPIQISDANNESKRLMDENKQLNDKLSAMSAKGLYIECHDRLMPTVIPPSGMIFILFISQYPTGHPINIISQLMGIPGVTGVLPKAGEMLPAGRRCDVTNYSDFILVNIRLVPEINYVTTVKTESGAQGHGIYMSVPGNIHIDKIDIGHDNSFVFYISSRSPDCTMINMPKKATAQRLGSEEEISIPVESNGQDMIPFSPFVPPAPSPSQ